jgi:uncharacterized GH25 family protein
MTASKVLNAPAGRIQSACRRAVLILGLGLAPGLAAAHYPWMTPAHYAPEPGNSLEFSIGWGHVFPGTDTMSGDRLESAEVLDAEGTVHPLALGDGAEFTTVPLPGKGPWVLAARQRPGFYSRTLQGGQRGSREEYPDALSCGHSSNTVKALLGAGDGAVDRPLGHPLEILPLAGDAGAAAAFAVKVLHKGEPWQGEIQAVYAGFEGAEGAYPLTAVSNREGIARLAFDRPGRWMIKVTASEAYPDPAICDQTSYNATLTLIVR